MEMDEIELEAPEPEACASESALNLEPNIMVETEVNQTAKFGDESTSTRTSSSKILISKRESTQNRKPQAVRLSMISAVEIQVFCNFVKNYKATGELKREDAIALDFMFGGQIIQQVFELVEDEQITIRKSPISRKVLIEVCGKSGDTYWIPPGHSLCQCMAYVHGKKDYCKHVLAAHLKLAITDKDKYKPMDDEELTKIYKELIEDALVGA